MCDYSVHNVASCPARLGDELVTTRFRRFHHTWVLRSRRAADKGLLRNWMKMAAWHLRAVCWL